MVAYQTDSTHTLSCAKLSVGWSVQISPPCSRESCPPPPRAQSSRVWEWLGEVDVLGSTLVTRHVVFSQVGAFDDKAILRQLIDG